jgi:hypothetical protein
MKANVTISSFFGDGGPTSEPHYTPLQMAPGFPSLVSIACVAPVFHVRFLLMRDCDVPKGGVVNCKTECRTSAVNLFHVRAEKCELQRYRIHLSVHVSLWGSVCRFVERKHKIPLSFVITK